MRCHGPARTADAAHNLVCVNVDMSRCAVLQSVGARERYDGEKGSGCNYACGQSDAESNAWSACTQEARQLRCMCQHVDSGGPEPHDEAGLVQSDNRALCLAEDE